jgi:hypothetical protein
MVRTSTSTPGSNHRRLAGRRAAPAAKWLDLGRLRPQTVHDGAFRRRRLQDAAPIAYIIGSRNVAFGLKAPLAA